MIAALEVTPAWYLVLGALVRRGSNVARIITWVVTGLSLSLGLLILIVGIPLTVLFFGSVRGLALLEGRLVEALDQAAPRRAGLRRRIPDADRE